MQPMSRIPHSWTAARTAITKLWAVAIVTAALVAVAAVAAPEFPALTGRVVDNANLLTADDKAAIAAELEALEVKSSDQFVVVTVPSLQGYPIEDFGYQLGRHWKIGQKKPKNGILMIVAPNERKVRIEVGYGLEPALTDSMAKIIIDNAILPRFRRGDFSGGIRQGVTDVRDVLLGDETGVKERAAGRNPLAGDGIMPMLFMLIWFAVVAFIIWRAYRSSMAAPPGTRRSRYRRNPWVIVVPGGSGGSGNWSGGSWGSSGDSGGGYSGGGGSFGGGGATGSW